MTRPGATLRGLERQDHGLEGSLDEATIGECRPVGGGNAEGVAELVAVVEPGCGDEHGLPFIVPQRHGLVACLWRRAEQHLPQAGRFAKPGSTTVGPPVRQARAHGLQFAGRHRPGAGNVWAEYRNRRTEMGFDPEAVALAAGHVAAAVRPGGHLLLVEPALFLETSVRPLREGASSTARLLARYRDRQG